MYGSDIIHDIMLASDITYDITYHDDITYDIKHDIIIDIIFIIIPYVYVTRMISCDIYYDIDHDIIHQYHLTLGVLGHTMISL